MSTSPRAPGRPIPAAARVRPQGFWGHVPYLRGAGWRRAQPGRGLQGTNLRSGRAGIPWGASAAGSGAATTGARRRRFGRRRVARATDIPRAAGALQDACRLATPGCHHVPRGARVMCPRRHRPTRRSAAMTTTSCTPVPMTTYPAPSAARGCSSRPPEPGRSARLPHRERRRPSPPCPRRRTAADRAQSFGEIRNDTGRGRPGFRRPRAARNPDRSGFGARRGDGRGEAGPECETRERAHRRQGAALGVRTRWPHVSVFKRRTEAQGMQQTAGE